MQQKILSKWGLLAVTSSGLFIFAIILFIFTLKNLTQGSSAVLIESVVAQSSQGQTNQEDIIVGLPVRLEIPSINVDASVILVGLTTDGAMDVPKDPAEVAWYSHGTRPGMIGSAVIAGHYDWINNIDAVFNNLHKLREGYKIFVEDEKGVINTFVVREIKKYNKDDDASDVFTSDDGKVHLNLITCTGSWDKAEKTFSERLIVFTDKEN